MTVLLTIRYTTYAGDVQDVHIVINVTIADAHVLICRDERVIWTTTTIGIGIYLKYWSTNTEAMICLSGACDHAWAIALNHACWLL